MIAGRNVDGAGGDADVHTPVERDRGARCVGPHPERHSLHPFHAAVSLTQSRLDLRRRGGDVGGGVEAENGEV